MLLMGLVAISDKQIKARARQIQNQQFDKMHTQPSLILSSLAALSGDLATANSQSLLTLISPPTGEPILSSHIGYAQCALSVYLYVQAPIQYRGSSLWKQLPARYHPNGRE